MSQQPKEIKESQFGEANTQSGKSGKPSNVLSLPSKCKAEGCAKKSEKAEFCGEHFDWFKEGLIGYLGEEWSVKADNQFRDLLQSSSPKKKFRTKNSTSMKARRNSFMNWNSKAACRSSSVTFRSRKT